MKDEGKTKKELLVELTTLRRRVAKLESVQVLGRRAANLEAINQLALDLATASPSLDPYKLVADQLKDITNALAVSVSTYDPDERALIVRRLAADGKLVARMNDLLGRDLLGLSTPVSAALYDQLVNEIVRKAPDLHATTFGVISKPISAAVQRVFGVDHFVGLALTHGNELIGTCVVVVPSGQTSPSEDVVETFARLAAASLRQRQAEEALRASEENLKLAQAIAQIGSWSWNIISGQVEWSDQLYEIFQAPPTEPSYELARSFVHPDDLNFWQNTVQQAIKRQEPFALDYRAIRSDGKTIWVHNETRAMFDSHGVFTGYRGTAQDITERKQAEDALQRYVSQLMLLNDVGTRIAGVLDLKAVLDRAVQLIHDRFDYHHVALFIVDDEREELVMRAKAGNFAHLFPPDHRLPLGEGMVGCAGYRGESQLANDVDSNPRYVNRYPEEIPTCSELAVPIKISGETVGVLDIQSPKPDAFEEDDVLVMETLAGQIAVTIENARLYEAERDARQQLRDLADYLQNAREAERKRVAREIHDELGQTLTALKFDLSQLVKQLPRDALASRDKADEMVFLIDHAIDTVRRVSTELRPGLLDDLGLAAAIEWQAEEFAQRTGIGIDLHLSKEAVVLESDVVTALFRIFQETLTNVARHARASQVRVELDVGPDQVMLRVRDDGRGITERELSSSEALGLLGMRERAHALGGEVAFEGVPSRSTTVTVRIPRGVR
jgi:signal transduction histidine kinase